jgi:hypothetical protein
MKNVLEGGRRIEENNQRRPGNNIAQTNTTAFNQIAYYIFHSTCADTQETI